MLHTTEVDLLLDPYDASERSVCNQIWTLNGYHSKLNMVGFTSNSRGTEGGADVVAGRSKAALDF